MLNDMHESHLRSLMSLSNFGFELRRAKWRQLKAAVVRILISEESEHMDSRSAAMPFLYRPAAPTETKSHQEGSHPYSYSYPDLT